MSLAKSETSLNKIKHHQKSNKTRRYKKTLKNIQKKQQQAKNSKKKKQLKRETRAKAKIAREKSQIKSIAKRMSLWFGEETIERIARSTGYLIRNGKMLPLAFVITLAFGTYGSTGKLVSLARCFSSWFEIKVKTQSISDRLKEKKTVNFLKSLFIKAVEFQLQEGFKNCYAKTFKMFSGVYLEDSTRFELPESVATFFAGNGGGASSAAMKLDFTCDITRNTTSRIEIGSASISDKTFGKRIIKQIKANALYIRDLGYLDLSVILEMIKRGAYFLSRLQKDINIYLEESSKTPVNNNDFFKERTEGGKIFDQIVYVSERKVPLRLIVEKVPEEVQMQRAKKFKSGRKKEPTEDYIIWSGFSVFITNIPAEMFASAGLIITLYKIRWQIELFFKRLKSVAKIDVIAVENKNAVLCMIYAKLIGILMGEIVISYAASICDEDEELSEYKINDWLQEGNNLGNALIDGTLEDLLIEMIEIFYLHCKDRRKKKKSLQRVVEDAIKQELALVDKTEIAA